jgi:hypothetical protein
VGAADGVDVTARTPNQHPRLASAQPVSLPLSDNRGQVGDRDAGAHIGARATRSAQPDRLLVGRGAGSPASTLSSARPQEQVSTLPVTPLLLRNELKRVDRVRLEYRDPNDAGVLPARGPALVFATSAHARRRRRIAPIVARGAN